MITLGNKLKTDVLVYIHCFDPVIDLLMSSDRDSHVHEFAVGREFNELENINDLVMLRK